MSRRDSARLSWPLIGMLVGGFMFRLALLRVHGKMHDVLIFSQWARVLMTYGTHGLYNHVEPWSDTAINYPPGYALLLLGVVRAHEFISPAGNPSLLVVLLKLPAIVADIVCAAISYTIVVRFASRSRATVAAAIAAFSPWTWPISAIMGQVDSVCAMFLLFALAFALNERFNLSWLFLAAGMLVKPFPIIVAPLLIAMQVRSRGFKPQIAIGPALSLVLAYAVSLPFAPSATPSSTFAWLASEYTSGQGLFPYTSYFAANVWTLFWQPTLDGYRILGISLQGFGVVAFGIVELFVLLAMQRRVSLATSQSERSRIFVAGWFVVLFAAFVLTTRMHERYLAYALAIAPALWSIGPFERRTLGILTITFVAGVGLAIVIGSRGPMAFATPMVRVVSLANVMTFVFTLHAFGRRDHS